MGVYTYGKRITSDARASERLSEYSQDGTIALIGV